MSCKSALYAANTSDQALVVNNVINFGSIVRRFGCNTNLSTGNAIITGSGYYDIDTNFIFTPDVAGTATITLYKDGVAIPGAETSFTAVADTLYNANIPAIIRETCNCESVLTAVLTGVAGTINNATILVEKI